MPAAAKRLRARLVSGVAASRGAEMHDLLGEDSVVTNGMNVWLDLVRVPPSGTWERRRADLFAAAEDWVGPEDASYEDGVELLIRRYLGGFGPATLDQPRRLGRDAAEGASRQRWNGFGCGASAARTATSCSISPAPRCPTPETPAAGALPARSGTPRSLCTPGGPGSSREEHRSKVFNVKTPPVGADVPGGRGGGGDLALRQGTGAVGAASGGWPPRCVRSWVGRPRRAGRAARLKALRQY